MTKTQIKAIGLNASRQLNAVSKDVYNRDLVTALNHEQLKAVSAFLNDLYGVLDAFYERNLKTCLADAMEYTELVKKRIDALSQAEAINYYDCYRLSAVIKRLRNLGHDIVTHQEPNLNNKGTHARYELIGEFVA